MTLQHMIELIQLHHPNVGQTLLTKMINMQNREFVKEAYANFSTSRIDLTGVTLAGSTGATPVNLAGSNDLTLQAYKDDTVDSITILPDADVLMYEEFIQRNNVGALVNVISVVIEKDGTVYFYDQYGNSLSEFPSDLVYLEVYYQRAPATLSTLSSVPEYDEEYTKAVCNQIIGELYTSRSDLPVLDRMNLSRHHRNLYQEQMFKARKFYRQHRSLISVTGVVTSEFSN